MRRLTAVILLACLATSLPLRAQQTDAPADDGDRQAQADQLAQWLADLAHNSPAVREAARLHLMGMSRRQLEVFQDIVARHQPLLPAQAATLREIVLHAYAAEEPYAGRQDMGFLGVELRTAPLPGEDPQNAQPTGVLITNRLLGFVGYRMLQEGDIVLGLAGQPDVRTDAFVDLATIIRNHPAGTELQLEVLRRGSVVIIPVTIDARPTDLDRFHNLDTLRSLRFRRAYDYWQEHFEPLIDRGVS